MMMFISFYMVVVFIDILMLCQLTFHDTCNAIQFQNQPYTKIKFLFLNNMLAYSLFRAIPFIAYVFPYVCSTICWLFIIISTVRDCTNILSVPMICFHMWLLLYFHELYGFWSTIMCIWAPNILQYISILSHNNPWLSYLRSLYINMVIIQPIQCCNHIWKNNTLHFNNVGIMKYVHTFVKFIMEHVQYLYWKSYTIDDITTTLLCVEKNVHVLSIQRSLWVIDSLYAPGGIWFGEPANEKIWTFDNNNKTTPQLMFTYHKHHNTIKFPLHQSWENILNFYEYQYKSKMIEYIHFLHTTQYSVYKMLPVGNKLRTLIILLLESYSCIHDGKISYKPPTSSIKMSTNNKKCIRLLYKQVYTDTLYHEDWMCSDTILEQCIHHINTQCPNQKLQQTENMANVLIVKVFLTMTQLFISHRHLNYLFPYPRNVWKFHDPIKIFDIILQYKGILVSNTCVYNLWSGLQNLSKKYVEKNNKHFVQIWDPIQLWPILSQSVEIHNILK
jgi:hypothetical protein